MAPWLIKPARRPSKKGMIYPINTHIRIHMGVDYEDSEGAPIPRGLAAFSLWIYHAIQPPRHLQLEGLLPTRSLWYAWCWPKTQITAARHHFHMKTPRVTWEEILFKWKNHVKDSRKKSSPGKLESGHLFFSRKLIPPKKTRRSPCLKLDIFRKIQRHVCSAGVFFSQTPNGIAL